VIQVRLGHILFLSSPFAGIWLAGELGTPWLWTSLVVVLLASRIFGVTLYGGGGV